VAVTAPQPPPSARTPAVDRTIWQEARRRFLRNRLATAGLCVVVVLIIFAVFANVLAPTPYDRSVLSETLQFPSVRHWLGTDQVGRDLLSRIIYGARTSLLVGFSVQALAFGIGVPLGVIGGLRPGTWTDFIVIRLVEVMSAFPNFLFALFILTVIGGGLTNVIFAIGITSWIEVTRLTRAQILSLRERDFVQAARALGANELHIVWYHLLPNALPPLIVMLALGIPNAIFAEAGLSFLGLGINDPIPSWGKMVGDSMDYIRVFWHVGFFPTLMIALAMLSFNFTGDGLRDALDPMLRNG
jgi:ABC-type dipeptide/oligopeptide/nickel transport system permease subunit